MQKMIKTGLIMRFIFGFIVLTAFTPVAHAFEVQYGPYFGFIADPDLNFSVRHLAFVDNYKPFSFAQTTAYQSPTWNYAPPSYQPYQPPQFPYYQSPQAPYYQYQSQISPINQKPIIYSIPARIARAGELISFTVQGYDKEGDYLQYTATNLPQGADFNPYTHVFSWMPTLLQVGQYRVDFRVSEGGVAYADTSASITVLHPDGYMPVSTCVAGPGPYFFNFNPGTMAREGNLYTYQVIGNPANNNQLTYRVVDGPLGLTIDGKSGYMRWVPAFNQGRPQAYEARIGIYNGVCESVQTFRITVEDVR